MHCRVAPEVLERQVTIFNLFRAGEELCFAAGCISELGRRWYLGSLLMKGAM